MIPGTVFEYVGETLWELVGQKGLVLRVANPEDYWEREYWCVIHAPALKAGMFSAWLSADEIKEVSS